GSFSGHPSHGLLCGSGSRADRRVEQTAAGRVTAAATTTVATPAFCGCARMGKGEGLERRRGSAEVHQPFSRLAASARRTAAGRCAEEGRPGARGGGPEGQGGRRRSRRTEEAGRDREACCGSRGGAASEGGRGSAQG